MIFVGLSHKNAPIEVRERLAIGRDRLPEVLARLTAHPAIEEALVLSTCNRVEVYASPRQGAPGPTRPGSAPPPSSAAQLPLQDEALRAVVSILIGIGGEAVRGHLVGRLGGEAVVHLFRVAASLDSMVVGEPQILGQMKDAIEIARAARALGARLGRAAHRAIKVGKRVRTETAIGAGQVSVSSVAIDLARQIFDDLAGRTALLVGAGEMAEAASKLLVRAGARLVVVNRSPERAAALAREVGGVPRPWAELERAVIDADIVISSTASPSYVLTLDLVRRARKARRGRSLFLIDIAVPRDIDPAVNKLDNVYLYDVDDLSQIVAQSVEGRAAEAARAEAIVADEAQAFEAWTLERALTPTIVGLRTRTRSILAAEVERSLAGKLRHLGPAERQALAMMIDAATNKLLHVPTTRLRAMASDPRVAEHVDSLRELFDIDGAQADGAAAPALAEAAQREPASGPRSAPPACRDEPRLAGERGDGGASPRLAGPRPHVAEGNGAYARQPAARPQGDAGVMVVANPAAAVQAAGLKGA
ncbi:glutamyl-tRNA reductase [Sorangium cellulosum]|uniref:Glutamyl-tRNA reductase n=1 Tax=Sorangium cellulosum TaxID=56 RepID=A0A4P2PWE3_SORCE|nr:glutamyl-tRNA reductase [Sorangium cellulosum]AUX21010.1 glutamyl-tRNA reductase [Sorangium cellulosum]